MPILHKRKLNVTTMPNVTVSVNITFPVMGNAWTLYVNTDCRAAYFVPIALYVAYVMLELVHVNLT